MYVHGGVGGEDEAALLGSEGVHAFEPSTYRWRARREGGDDASRAALATASLRDEWPPCSAA